MATVTAGYTWTSGETVTPAKLNSAAAPTVVVANDEITTAKILDANVTAAKMAATLDLSSKTVTLPDSSVAAAKLVQPLTLATAQNTTSGTSIDFTGIPSWVKRITVMFRAVSSNGSSQHLIRLGTSSGFSATGYSSYTGWFSSAGGATAVSSTGLVIHHGINADTKQAHMTITLVSGTTWVASHCGGYTNGTTNFALVGGGSVTLADTLDRIRLTTANGTDAFDAGSVNIMYEG